MLERMTNPESHKVLGLKLLAGFGAEGAAASWPPETPQSCDAAERRQVKRGSW